MNRLWCWLVPGWALLALLAGVAIARPAPPEVPAPMPTELQYVPTDAAFFLHADAARIWTSDQAKSFRAADKTPFTKLEDTAKQLGVKIDELKSVVLFIPKLKTPNDSEQFGVVLTFSRPVDKTKFAAGVAGLLPKNAKFKVFSPSNTVAVVLVGLGEEYTRPQPADGPLTASLQAAASGKHALVAATTLANLPDELQGDDIPSALRPVQSLLKAESLTATVDLGTSLDLSVRVKTRSAAQAADAKKALAAFTTLVADEFDRQLEDKDAAKDLVKVFQAALRATKGAKFAIEGTEARMTATLPLNGLPLASAYLLATSAKVTAAASRKSANNLKQIGLALHNYHDANGTLPSAAICDKKGKPLLSWRVAILPFMEQVQLYNQFKLDEPWDSDHNKKLIAQMPVNYSLPGSKRGTTETHYRVFVGNGAGFEWAKGMKLVEDIADGTSNTLMVATAAEAVTWTKPDELEFDPEKDMTKLIGLAGGQMQVVMFDGSVRTLRKLPSKETLNAVITRNGGEIIGPDF